MVNSIDIARNCVERLPNSEVGEAESLTSSTTIAALDRSLFVHVATANGYGPVSRSGLRLHKESLDDEHRRFCLERARRFKSLIVDNENCQRRLIRQSYWTTREAP